MHFVFPACKHNFWAFTFKNKQFADRSQNHLVGKRPLSHRVPPWWFTLQCYQKLWHSLPCGVWSLVKICCNYCYACFQFISKEPLSYAGLITKRVKLGSFCVVDSPGSEARWSIHWSDVWGRHSVWAPLLSAACRVGERRGLFASRVAVHCCLWSGTSAVESWL